MEVNSLNRRCHHERKKNSKAFNRIHDQLKANGYREKDVTISSGKAMVLGVIFALPFIVIIGLLYRFVLIKRAHLSEIGGSSFYIMFIAIVAISVVVHELLHGIGWAISSGKGWKVVGFNINAMMPSCTCKVALKKKTYLIGVLAPFVVLGLSSILFIFVYPGTVSFLTMMVNFVAAGADLLIAFHILREEDAFIVDHPTEAGYIAFYK